MRQPLDLTNKGYTNIADQIAAQGYWLYQDLSSIHLASDLMTLAEAQADAGQFRAAMIGQAEDEHRNKSVRRDQIHWLDLKAPGLVALDRFLGEIQQKLRRELLLPINHFEGHFAHYGPGDFYRRHSDNFKGRSHRLITFIIYLNQPEKGGGELIIYPEDSPQITVHPTPGQVLAFDSRLDHEVALCLDHRWSFTGWFSNKSL